MIHASRQPASRTADLRSLLSEIESVNVLTRIDGLDRADATRIEHHYCQLLEAIERALEFEATGQRDRRRRSPLPRASAMLAAPAGAIASPPPERPRRVDEPRARLPRAQRTSIVSKLFPKPVEPKPVEFSKSNEGSPRTPAIAGPAPRNVSSQSRPSGDGMPWRQRVAAAVDDDTMPDFRVARRISSSESPDSADWTFRVRWWSGPLALGVAATMLLTLISAAVVVSRFDSKRSALVKELRKPALDEPTIRGLTTALLASPMGRFDADRDYLAAVSTWRLSDSKDPVVRDNIHRFLRRSVQKTPASFWRRLSLAAFSLQDLDQDLSRLKRMAWNEPPALSQLASLLDRVNRSADYRECRDRLNELESTPPEDASR